MREVLTLVGVAYGYMFVASSVMKVDGREEWRRTVAQLAVWKPLEHGAPWGVPAAEACVGLLAMLMPRLGVALAGGLLIWFGVIVAYVGRRADNLPCNCFGPTMPSTIGPQLALRNGLLGLMALLVAALAGGGWTRITVSYPAVLGGLLVCVGAVLLLEYLRVMRRRTLDNRQEVAHG
jgi:hypothetical protein